MKKILNYVDGFFFRRVSASGFGLMRIGWGLTVLLSLVSVAPDVVRYYSDAGIMPQDLGYLVFRSQYRFTLLAYITDPTAVILLWCIFVTTTVCMTIGLWPRVMTITSVLLLFSFHERNLQPLGGGDTVLRTLGFILMIAPEINAFSVERLSEQWAHWQRTGTYLAPLKTHIWPYRLLLWQVIIIYVTSGWDKLQGTMWLDGTVIEAVFHHIHFTRWSDNVMNNFVWLSPYGTFYTLIFEYAWLLLLVPKELWHVLPVSVRKHSLKRLLIGGGLLFHWGIFVFMSVGAFPFAMTTAFVGLMLDDDWKALKRMMNNGWHSKITVLYDGICHLCRRSIFVIGLMDSLGRVHPVDFRKNRMGIAEKELDRAMHVLVKERKDSKESKGSNEWVYKGFDGFRYLCWHIPVLMMFAPLLYVPGVAPVGRVIYARIAENRKKCADGVCTHG